MDETTFPEFRGKSLIGIPSTVQQVQIGFLEGEFGKAFLEEYQGRAKTDYKDARALNVLRYDDGIVKGSGPFAAVLANQILNQEGLRTANQSDLETALKNGALNLRGTYEDTALVLRTEDDLYYPVNTALAKELAKQVKARGVKFSPKNPVMIPLTSLELNVADNYYGLAFNLTENGRIYEAPILSKVSGLNFSSENIDKETGLPRKLGNGERRLYTRDNGISEFYLDNDLSVDSDDGELDISYSDGRIVVISLKITYQN